MQNEYLVYTAIANLQTELRAELKQMIQILEEIRDLMVPLAQKSQSLTEQHRPVIIDQERQSV